MKPWDKDFIYDDDNIYLADEDGDPDTGVAFGPISEDDGKLMAAAPALARALCLVEWNFDEFQKPGTGACPCCTFLKPLHYDCELDAALTAAGLTPEDREAVRKASGNTR